MSNSRSSGVTSRATMAFLKRCRLEGLLPLDDAFLDVGNPYGRGRRVDPQLDRLLRFDQFAFLVTLHVLGFRLQPPAVDERAFLGLLLFVVEVEVPDLEIAHAVVGEPRSHRLPGEQHQVRGDLHGQGDRRALLGVRGREERFDDDVFRGTIRRIRSSKGPSWANRAVRWSRKRC